MLATGSSLRVSAQVALEDWVDLVHGGRDRFIEADLIGQIGVNVLFGGVVDLLDAGGNRAGFDKAAGLGQIQEEGRRGCEILDFGVGPEGDTGGNAAADRSAAS